MACAAAPGCSDATHTVATVPAGLEPGADGYFSSKDGNNGGSAGDSIAGDGDGDDSTPTFEQDTAEPTPAPGAPGLCLYTTSPARMDAMLIVDTYITLPLTGWLMRALDGIDMYVNDPRSAGSGAGAIFIRTECEASAYDPPDAEVGLLPDNAMAITDAFPSSTAAAVTPVTPALIAATAEARNRATQNAKHKQIIILVSDGIAFSATPCSLSDETPDSKAADAFNGTPSIPVYVVQLAGEASAIPTLPDSSLNATAKAGGTGTARPVSLLNANSMSETLHSIRTEAQECEYAIPADTVASKTSLVLNFFASPVEPVDDAEACSGSTSGFYYDDPDAPTTLIACPLVCGRIKAAGHESVRVKGPCPE